MLCREGSVARPFRQAANTTADGAAVSLGTLANLELQQSTPFAFGGWES
jgi:hypothetical protein